jgi:hypothetical protein
MALLALAIPATAAANIPRGFIGLSPQNVGNAADYGLMREAGVSSVRLPMFWVSIQARNPFFADPDWAAFDREVASAAREGIRIMPFVWGTPHWLAGEPKDLPVRTPLQRWLWASFLREAVERYGPEGSFWEDHSAVPYLPVERWEIWNEENIVSFANDPRPARFATLIKVAGRVVHRTDPEAEVIVGGFFGRPLQVPPNVATGDYLNRLYRARGIRRHFDAVGLHPYVADARAMRGQIRNLRRIMRAHGDGSKPIYLTELGWGSASGPTRWQRGFYGQAKQLSRSFAMISANRKRWRLGGVWWYTWTDEGGSCSFCRSAGLLTADREAKPSWYRFNAWTGGDAGAVPRARPGNS